LLVIYSMAAILNFLSGDWEADDDDDDERRTKVGSGSVIKGSVIVNTLTSLCSSNNSGIPFCDQLVYGIDGAVIKKEKGFKKHYTGNIGRVYLQEHLESEDGYKVGWVLNDAFPDCMVCGESFEVLHRRHHCRGCGCLVCAECSRDKANIRQLSENPKITWRVCDLCTCQHPPNAMWDLNNKEYEGAKKSS
jgi:hypothetical protein